MFLQKLLYAEMGLKDSRHRFQATFQSVLIISALWDVCGTAKQGFGFWNHAKSIFFTLPSIFFAMVLQVYAKTSTLDQCSGSARIQNIFVSRIYLDLKLSFLWIRIQIQILPFSHQTKKYLSKFVFKKVKKIIIKSHTILEKF